MGSTLMNLTCPSCGGKLQITKDIDRFACGYCGNEQIVIKTGGVVALTPVVNEIKHISTGVDKTASELALQRIDKDINRIQPQFDYWASNIKSRQIIIPILIVGIIAGILMLIFTYYRIPGFLMIILAGWGAFINIQNMKNDKQKLEISRNELNNIYSERNKKLKNVQ